MDDKRLSMDDQRQSVGDSRSGVTNVLEPELAADNISIVMMMMGDDDGR